MDKKWGRNFHTEEWQVKVTELWVALIFRRKRELGHSLPFSYIVFNFCTSCHFLLSTRKMCMFYFKMCFKRPGQTAFFEHKVLYISLMLPVPWLVLPHTLPIIMREKKNQRKSSFNFYWSSYISRISSSKVTTYIESLCWKS